MRKVTTVIIMQRSPTMGRLTLAGLILGSVILTGMIRSRLAAADEGMWTYNDFPAGVVGERYGFTPDAKWLEHVRLSSVRLAGGCSGSIVSPEGLVMTNHHCATACIERLSTAETNFMERGFYAETLEDERRCPQMELNVLTEIVDVTERIRAATRDKSGEAFANTRRATVAEIEGACATGDEWRCEVVTLYHGGQYHLYKYRRYQDVRLVFAPEFSVAFFGGDPDNFMFPRYNLDVSFVRIWDGDKPMGVDHFLKWSKAGAGDGELTFVSGNPGRTSRLNTVSQLLYQRDVRIPGRLFDLLEARGTLEQFAARGEEQARVSGATRFYIGNGVKAYKGMRNALIDRGFFQGLVEREEAFRATVAADEGLKERYGDAWQRIEEATAALVQARDRYLFIEAGRAFWAKTFEIARSLTRAADELPKPNSERLKEFAEARLPALTQRLFSEAPIYDDFEIETLTLSLTRARETLGPDDPFITSVLGKESPRELATRLVTTTGLKDVALRRALFAGGAEAIKASKDPMILLAQAVDAEARAIRKAFEDDVESVLTKEGERIARARFELYGTSVYPDATFTPRLSFGVVKGWKEGSREISPFTTMAGAFKRHTGAEPFALPKSWLDAKPRLALSTPLDFCTTNDIIGGNSGSPVFNQAAEIVGLIFDGNIHSLGGDYGFDEVLNRAIAVHSSAIIEALRSVYDAKRLLKELVR